MDACKENMKTLNPEFVKLNPDSRLYNIKVPIIGLTGGMGTGKSTVSKMLLTSGIPVIDADQLVKMVYSQKATQHYIRKNHPEAWKGNTINFSVLREKFFTDKDVKREVENVIYRHLPQAFLTAYQSLGSPPFVVYDVPLLFEKKLQSRVDLTVVVYAPVEMQRARIMARDRHAEYLIQIILDQQLDIEDKKIKADFVIDNSSDKEKLAEEVQNFLRQTLI
jgi:dephospho-CoA kinase